MMNQLLEMVKTGWTYHPLMTFIVLLAIWLIVVVPVYRIVRGILRLIIGAKIASLLGIGSVSLLGVPVIASFFNIL